MMRFRFGLCAAIASASLLVPNAAAAAIVKYGFTGKIIDAENFDPPELRGNYKGFFQIGMDIYGNLTFDTDMPGDGDEFEHELPLLGFDIHIGGVDFSDRFLPRLIGRGSDGTIAFVSGGASQGGGASLNFDVGSFSNSYPTLGELKGKVAQFSYADYYPSGGIVLGQAMITAVPEPSTWAMLIIGIGVVGSSMRRRKGQLEPNRPSYL
jgi:hypothetical protein